MAGGAREEVADLVFQLLREETAARLQVRAPSAERADTNLSVQSAIEGLELLRSVTLPRAEEFREGAAKRFTLARAFKTAEELEAVVSKGAEEVKEAVEE